MRFLCGVCVNITPVKSLRHKSLLPFLGEKVIVIIIKLCGARNHGYCLRFFQLRTLYHELWNNASHFFVNRRISEPFCSGPSIRSKGGRWWISAGYLRPLRLRWRRCACPLRRTVPTHRRQRGAWCNKLRHRGSWG